LVVLIILYNSYLFSIVDNSGPKNYSMEWNGMWNKKKLMEWNGNVMKIDKTLWNGMEVE
jgi:hypothetical protein